MIVDIVVVVVEVILVILSRCSGSRGSGSSRRGVVEYRWRYACVGIEIWMEIVGILLLSIIVEELEAVSGGPKTMTLRNG